MSHTALPSIQTNRLESLSWLFDLGIPESGERWVGLQLLLLKLFITTGTCYYLLLYGTLSAVSYCVIGYWEMEP